MNNYLGALYGSLLLLLLCNQEAKAQYIYNFSSHNFLQFNPAYAGQDTNHCFFLGGEYSSELFKGFKGAPYTNQFSYAGNFKKFRSALAASGVFSKIGLSTQFDYGIIAYNYNFIINENSNLRVGLNWTERIFHIDLSNTIFNDGADVPNLSSAETTHGFNFDAGFWYTLKKLNLGFSIQNILNKRNTQPISSLYERTINAITVYEFLVTKPIKIKPAIIFQNFSGSYSTCLLTNSFVFEDTFIFGVGYMLREFTSGPLYIEAGANAGNHVQLMLGYSNTLNNKRSYSFGNISAMIKVNLF